jgi:hypothetical protein
MSDEIRRLHERVDALHRRLTDAGSLAPELRGELDALLTDLDRHLSAEERVNASISDRLVDAGQHFESAHPVLGRTLGNLADALSRMGI